MVLYAPSGFFFSLKRGWSKTPTLLPLEIQERGLPSLLESLPLTEALFALILTDGNQLPKNR